MKVTLLPTISPPCRWAMSMPSMIRGGSVSPSASCNLVTPSCGFVTNASGCQNSCSPFAGPGTECVQRLDFIAQLAGPLEIHLLAGLDHVLFELVDDLFFVAVQEADEAVDVFAIGLRVDLGGTGRGALPDRIQQAGPKKAAVAIVARECPDDRCGI